MKLPEESISKRLIVVAGFARSHLLSTIGDLADADIPVLGITAIAPKKNLIKFNGNDLFGFEKFVNRRELTRGAPIQQVKFAELIHQLSMRLPESWPKDIYEYLNGRSFEIFSSKARKFSQPKIFSGNESLLIRSGFGKSFTNDSRLYVSDASLAHPFVLPGLISSGKICVNTSPPADAISQLILADTERADKILVNSDFVKETFVLSGVKSERIEVAYLPPIGVFKEESLLERTFPENGSTLRVIFAGTFEQRKGFTEILEVIEKAAYMSKKIVFTLIGNWAPGTTDYQVKLKGLRGVKILKWQTQLELLRHMQDADVFLFPSRAEGGARVVTEAMAAGLAVITTVNSGTPISHLLDGLISEVGNVDQILSFLELLGENSQLRESLSKAAKKTVEKMVLEQTYLFKVLDVCQMRKI